MRFVIKWVKRGTFPLLGNRLAVPLLGSGRLLRSAFVKFLQDYCAIRSNAIAYSIIISIIPLLTIFVQLAKINRSVVQTQIAAFLASYGFADSSELLSILDEIMSRAETIAGVGFILVLYSASNFFRHLEDSFDYIYRSPKKRAFLHRIAIYVAAFVFVPLLLILAKQLIQSVHFHFAVPELRSLIMRNNTLWVAASNGAIFLYEKNGKSRKIRLQEKVNQNAPYRDFFIDKERRRVAKSWEPPQSAAGLFYESPSHSLYDLLALAQDQSAIYTISSGGNLYYSQDEGRTWDHHRFIISANNKLHTPKIVDMYKGAK